jgi:GT2 family glycosyltransferase
MSEVIEPPRVSVVIPTFQRRASVARAIAALQDQTVSAAEYEVIVCIDGSNDGTREMVREMEVPFRLRGLWVEHRGRAAACNAGIAAAAGGLIVILDDDMEPSPQFLEAHERAHVGPCQRGVMGAVPIVVRPSDPPVLRFIGQKFNAHMEALSAPGYTLKLKDFYSGNFSIDASVLRKVGCFDEAFRAYGNEDLELALRLRRAGVQLVLDGAAWARQHYLKSLPELARDQIAKGRTAVLLARKHPEALSEVKLGDFARGSRKWRIARAILLGLATWWPRSPEHVTWIVNRLTEHRPERAGRLYPLLLDYLFWVGAAAARHEAGAEESATPNPASPGR